MNLCFCLSFCSADFYRCTACLDPMDSRSLAVISLRCRSFSIGGGWLDDEYQACVDCMFSVIDY